MNPATASQLKIATLLGAVIVGVGLGAALALDLGLTGLWLTVLIGTPISIRLEHLIARRARAASAHPPAGKAHIGA